MNERRLTFQVTNSLLGGEGYGTEIGLEEFSIGGGVRVDPTTVRIEHTLQNVTPLERSLVFERWRLDGPYRTWTPGSHLSFEGLVLDARLVHIRVGNKQRFLSWLLPVCMPPGGDKE